MPIPKTMGQVFKGAPVPKVSPDIRKKIFESFLTTPERKEIYEGLAPAIEKELSQKGIEKAYLGGSFTTEKPIPGDIDLFLDVRPSYFHSTFGAPEPPFGLHVTPLMPGKEAATRVYKEILEEGKKRYGKEHDWVRILGLSGVAGVGALLGKPKEVEAAPYNFAKMEKILRSLATTPERKALVEKLLPSIEEVIKETPGTKRAFVGGSFVTKKPKPSDLDIALQVSPEYKENFLENVRKGMKRDIDIPYTGHNIKEALDVTRYQYGAGAPNDPTALTAKELIKEGQKRYGKDYHWKRILGVLGTLGVGTSVGAPEEAEAMPLGKLFPTKQISQKFLKTSSAEKMLVGSEVSGKIIKKVHTGKGDWRYLEFEDGTTRALTKDYVNDLSRAIGTKKYLSEATRTPSQALPMAQRSLETRLSRKQLQNEEEETFKQAHQAYLERVKEIDPTLVPKTVYVRYPKNDPNARVISLPEVYADVLEKQGIVTRIGAPKR